MPTLWSLDTLDAMLPVIAECAHLGVRVDVHLRRQMRAEVAETHAALLAEFDSHIGAFGGDKRLLLNEALSDACEKRDYFRRAAKGRELFEDAVPEMDRGKAAESWVVWKGKAEELRADLRRYENVGPTSKDVIRDFFFRDPLGLRLKPNKRTPTGVESVGRKELSALLLRADVQAKMEKDPRYGALRVLSEAERLRSVAALHLGLKDDMNLRADTQLHKGRLAVVYNPVKMRFSAGASAEKPHPHAIQLHNPPKKLEGGGRVWHIRRQFLPDRDDQLITKFDWKGFEGYVMAWQAGARIGYWRWLERLYDGIDNHCATACIIEPSLPSADCRGEENCPHRTTLIDMGGMMRPARDGGKQVNHAYTLGGRENFLKENYRIPVADGRKMLARMDASAHGQAVKALHEHIEDEAARTNAVTTPFGEAIDFWSFELRNGRRVPRQPRECYAVCQQGTAALIMQSRMGPVAQVAKRRGGRFLLQVHDEFVMCEKREKIPLAVSEICGIMSDEIPQMPVPFDGGRGLRIPVDAGVGANWGDAK